MAPPNSDDGTGAQALETAVAGVLKKTPPPPPTGVGVVVGRREKMDGVAAVVLANRLMAATRVVRTESNPERGGTLMISV